MTKGTDQLFMFGARSFWLLPDSVASRLGPLAAIVPVFNTNDAFAGSLRQALQDAPPGSTIIFQIPTTDPGYDATLGRYFISLTSARLLITKSLTIDAGTQKITIQRSFAGGTPTDLPDRKLNDGHAGESGDHEW